MLDPLWTALGHALGSLLVLLAPIPWQLNVQIFWGGKHLQHLGIKHVIMVVIGSSLKISTMFNHFFEHIPN